jgi:hypothetical protein
VISTDRSTPSTIVTPEPVVQEAATPQRSAPPEPAPVAAETAYDPPPAPAETMIPSAPPASAETPQAPVPTTVRSGSYAVTRSDAVFVRVYRMPNGRRITEYSNMPRTHTAAKTGRSLSTERVFVVPAEPGDAYAYAPR